MGFYFNCKLLEVNMIHLGTQEISTERLFLRKIKQSDSVEIFEGLRNQKEFLYYANKEPATLEQQIQSLQDIDKKYQNLAYYNWVITEKISKAIIGMINLRVDEKNDSVEFNYAIDNRFTNKGYMTEALKAVIDFALNKINANRIQGGCCVENFASKKVMEKCGLSFEGTLKNFIKLKDGYHDMFMFAKIKQ